ncbi:hypothetical protein IWX81_001456 [Salinibacterium sp. CAN_S4]
MSSAGANRDDGVSSVFRETGAATGLTSRVGSVSTTRRAVSFCTASAIQLRGELYDGWRMGVGDSGHVFWTVGGAAGDWRSANVIAVKAITLRLGVDRRVIVVFGGADRQRSRGVNAAVGLSAIP